MSPTLQNQFGESYARVYDLIYKDKDYEAECDYIVSLLKKHQDGLQIRSILDIACGTGGHAIPLAQRGFLLTAQDISDAMVNIGRKKASEMALNVAWRPGVAMQRFSYANNSDAVICMFSAIDYITSDKDLRAVLSNVRKSLRTGGLFVMDFWNAAAVKNTFTPKREKTINHEEMTVKRISTTRLDTKKYLAYINMKLTTAKDGNILSDEEETHTCRYYNIDKMKNALVNSGFDVLNMHPFMDEVSTIDDHTWNVTTVCRAIS